MNMKLCISHYTLDICDIVIYEYFIATIYDLLYLVLIIQNNIKRFFIGCASYHFCSNHVRSNVSKYLSQKSLKCMYIIAKK